VLAVLGHDGVAARHLAVPTLPPEAWMLRGRPADRLRRSGGHAALRNTLPAAENPAMGVSLVSPELALVDPILRADALAALPRVEPFAFLALRDTPPPAKAVVAKPHPPLLVAAGAYLVSSLARVVVMDALFVFGLAAAVAGLQLAS
jgi:hypothetical protein